MDPTTPPRASFLLRRAAPWLVAVLVTIYGTLLWRDAGVCAGGSDSSGYLNQARLFLKGRLRAAARPLPGLPMDQAPLYAYTPLGFVPRPAEAQLVPTYPTGLSLLCALGAALAGWEHGPTLVLVLHALAGLAVVFALGRALGLDPALALLGALLLGVSPLYLMFALQTMSDLPALVWTGAAVLLAWHTPRRPPLAVAAGFALGVAVLLRPTNALLLVPVLLALGASWRRWLWLGLGGLPAAAWFMYANFRAYGHPLLTGYGDVNTLLALQWAPAGLRHYVRWLPALLSPVVILALGLPFLGRTQGRAALVLGSWILVVLGFYAFYFHTHETWWYLRFVLPAFPALIVGALLVAARLLAARPALVRAGTTVGLALLVAVNGAYWSRHWHVRETGRQEQLYPRAAEWVRTQLPPEAVILAMQNSGALFFYTDRVIVRYDALDDRWPAVRDAARAVRRPLFAVLHEFELPSALEEKAPGRWTRLHQLGPISFWRLEPDA